MQRIQPRLMALVVLLAVLAGFVDALAFSGIGGFFAASMSGNTTRLGVGIAAGAIGDALTAFALVLSFVAGVIVASVAARARPRQAPAAVLATVTLLLVLAALLAPLHPGAPPLLLLAVAMGAQGGLSLPGAPALGVADLAGTLVRLGQQLAAALMGEGDRRAWLPHALLWLAFAAGAVAGARCHLALGEMALWIPAVAAAGLTRLVAASEPALARHSSSNIH